MTALQPGVVPDEEHVRLTERLAIVDEIHDEIAHDLAVASIHLGLLAPDGPDRAAHAHGVARASCLRALEAVRGTRTKLGADPATLFDPEAVPRDLGHLAALAASCGASIDVGTLPPPARLRVGLLLTTARVAEAFLRLSAGRGAAVAVHTRLQTLVVEVSSSLPAAAWAGTAPDLARVRERMSFFDGSLRAAKDGGGSRAVAELPLL